mgnify:CR=1 FL=1
MIDITVLVWFALTFTIGSVIDRHKKKNTNFYLDR